MEPQHIATPAHGHQDAHADMQAWTGEIQHAAVPCLPDPAMAVNGADLDRCK